MCHHHVPVTELSDTDVEELLEEHSVEELRAAHTDEELEQLGLAA